jgi:prophage maintenance system killer protein
MTIEKATTRIKIIAQLEEEGLTPSESFHLYYACGEYAHALKLLELYDKGLASTEDKRTGAVWYPDKNAIDVAIRHIKCSYGDGESGKFGEHRDTSIHVHGAFELICLGSQDEELYPNLAEKAANLFYLIVKNHYLKDGNKRIAAVLMLWFMDINDDMLTIREEGGTWGHSLTYNIVYALAVFVAKSKSKDKEIVVGLLIEIIDTYRLKRDFLPE